MPQAKKPAHHKPAGRPRTRVGESGLLNMPRKELEQTKRQIIRISRNCERHAAEMHYTQDARRWQGIADTRLGVKGEFPNYADCSAFATWVIWSAVHEHLPRQDFINDLAWKGGHTGTLVKNGVKVDPNHLHIGDLVFYGDEGWRPEHVAIYIGNGLVCSFGSEPGPFILPVRYRSDVHIWTPRRFIR